MTMIMCSIGIAGLPAAKVWPADNVNNVMSVDKTINEGFFITPGEIGTKKGPTSPLYGTRETCLYVL